jgi:DNA polymerase V
MHDLEQKSVSPTSTKSKVAQIAKQTSFQMSIFDHAAVTQRSTQLMTALDMINRDYGHGTVRSGASGFTQRWAMRNENRSPRYTTRWDELPIVH